MKAMLTMMTNKNDEEKRKVIDWIGRHRMTSTSDKQTNMRQQSGLKQETGKIFIYRAIYENKKMRKFYAFDNQILIGLTVIGYKHQGWTNAELITGSGTNKI